MNRLQDTLKTVCKKYPEIAFVYIFGSNATGEQSALSDIDIAIYLEKQEKFNFNKLLLFHGDCCRALKRNDIDILVLNATKNLILMKDIITKGKIIYNVNQELLDDFEVKTLHFINDFTERNRPERTL
jgi:predicted nucleotidyltransferase